MKAISQMFVTPISLSAAIRKDKSFRKYRLVYL